VTSVFISAPFAVIVTLKIPKSVSLVAANCMQSLFISFRNRLCSGASMNSSHRLSIRISSPNSVRPSGGSARKLAPTRLAESLESRMRDEQAACEYRPAAAAVGHTMENLIALKEPSVRGIGIPQDLIREEKPLGWIRLCFGHDGTSECSLVFASDHMTATFLCQARTDEQCVLVHVDK
jgi:hypothetical protein